MRVKPLNSARNGDGEGGGWDSCNEYGVPLVIPASGDFEDDQTGEAHGMLGGCKRFYEEPT